MAKNVLYLKQVAPEWQLKRGAVKTETALISQKQASAIFDSAALDSAGVANSAVGAHGLGIFLPLGAVITKAYFQVKTAFTSAASTATIAIKAQSANDIYTATAVSGAMGSTGFIAGVQDGTVGNMLSLTAERELTISVAVQALTAGKGILVVEYSQGL
jgi:hypothetical protein